MRKGFKKATAKHGLNKTWIRAFGLSFLRDQTVERERGEEEKRRRRGRGREEEEKKRKAKPKRYETMTINMNTCFWLYGTTLDKDIFN